MNEKLKKILSNMKKYNAGIMFQEVFGFEPETEYDVLVIAPGWKPTKIIRNPAYKVTELAVSDNSATGVPLLGRVGEVQDKYHYTRSVIIPDMIFRIAESK